MDIITKKESPTVAPKTKEDRFKCLLEGTEKRVPRNPLGAAQRTNFSDIGGSGRYNNSQRNGGFKQMDFGSSVSEGAWSRRGGRYPIVEYEAQIFKSTEEKSTGLNFDHYDKIDVVVSGNNSEIEPISSFLAVGMSDTVMNNIKRVHYDRPTPVQKYGISILLADRDLMACAQTGSGKTAAFLFPFIIKMVRDGPPPPTSKSRNRIGEPVFIVMTPTRELALQIGEEAMKFAFNTGIATVVVYGGADSGEQIRQIQRGCDICVATPGRLIDILGRGRISVQGVKYLVLDEADRMLDMGFVPQITDIISHFGMPSETRQTAMFSATFPKAIQQLAANFMRNYVYLTVGRVGSTSKFIRQCFAYAEESMKPRKLLTLLQNYEGKVLIFCETKVKANAIEVFLNKNNINAVSIHGDKSQQQRSEALHMFKHEDFNVLVATDVASRGLDIHCISWVINLDLPNSIDEYVHRIGRTGRAGNSGMATSFVNEENSGILRPMINLLEEATQEIPGWLLDLFTHCSSAADKGFGSNRYHRGGNSSSNYPDGRSTFGGQDFRRSVETRKATVYGSSSNNSSTKNNIGSTPMSFRGNASNDCW